MRSSALLAPARPAAREVFDVACCGACRPSRCGAGRPGWRGVAASSAALAAALHTRATASTNKGWVGHRRTPPRGSQPAASRQRALSTDASLLGGRPCGGCGQLASPSAGRYIDLGIFYCAACWPRFGVPWTSAGEADHAVTALLHADAERCLKAGDVEAMRACLRVRPQISGLRGAFGRSLLHHAAELGDAAACEALLGSFAEAYGEHVELLQALELYQDAFAVTAGELALIGRHHDVFDLLVTKACSRQRPSNYSREANKAYVKERLKYEGDVLFDAAGRGVMMGWEDPLMARHAGLLAPRPGLSVLNIGFGLGLVDGYLQARRPSTHVIVEAHPDVYAEIRRRGWMEKPGLGVIHGRWQDVARDIIAQGPYDGVFFDTYAEMYGDMQDFFALLPELVRTGGRFSFFNGLSDKNIYAQAVSCRIAQIDLAKLGFACLYEPVVLGEVGDDEWCKVATKYWSLETYYLPLAIRLPSQEDLAHGVGVELPTGALRASAVQVDDRVGPVLSEKMERAQQEMRVAAQ